MSSPSKQPKSKPSGTDSVSKKQSFQEWAAAGGGVPLQYKGREHVWDRKVKQYAEGGGVAANPDAADIIKRFDFQGMGGASERGSMVGGRLGYAQPLDEQTKLRLGLMGHYAKGRGFQSMGVDAGDIALQRQLDKDSSLNVSVGAGKGKGINKANISYNRQFDEGGEVHMQAGGISRLLKGLKGTQEVLPAAEREANLKRMLAESKTPMRLYHGTMASEGGKGQEAIRKLKPSKEGALGSGVYLTPQSEFASTYAGFPARSQLERDIETGSDFAKESARQMLDRMNRGAIETHEVGGNMLPVFAQIKNPLILRGSGVPDKYKDPMIEALELLGMDSKKASRMVERAYDQKGYIGKEVESRARAAGYDGLMQYRDGNLSEVVSYNPNAVKSAIGNRGTYDMTDPDLNKAAGGAIHMQVGGIARLLKGAKGPQSEALALAQQRAALPPSKGGLGLPPNNTPEQRAAAMGFDLDNNYVHNTSLPFDKIKEGEKFSGIFTLPNYSANYGNVDMPLVARGKIASSSDLRNSIKNPSKQKQRAIDEELPGNITDPADTADAYVEMQKRRNELARKLGYTGVKMNDEFGDTVSLVSPDSVRSRFAAFDPFRKDAATAAALGVAAPNLLAKEQKKAEGGAAFGVFPQMKPRRAKQDREAAKNVPVDLARGFVSGVLGAPGDIESFARLPYELITGKDSPTFLPTSEDIEKRLPFRSEAPVSRAASGAGQLAGGFYMGPGSPLRAVGALPGAIKHGATEFAKASAAGAPRVIKPKGGNFLTGSVEKALAPLKTRTIAGETPAQRIPRHEALLSDPSLNKDQIDRVLYQLGETKKEAAIDQWVDRNLGNYLKNEMATPQDPIRLMIDRRIAEIDQKFAKDMERVSRVEQRAAAEADPRRKANLERQAQTAKAEAEMERDISQAHVTHMPPNEIDFANQYLAEPNAVKRLRAGFPIEGLGVSKPAEAWEALSDTAFNVARASEHTKPLTASEIRQGYKSTVDDNPWLTKLNPDTPVYYPENMDSLSRDLGFDHVMDVMRQDVAAGRIAPDQLGKISMEQAVRRTSEFDQEMAKKMREAQIKATEGMPVHKEYPEGYKWIELNMPEAKVPEGATWEEYNGMQRLFGPKGESLSHGATKDEAIKLLNRKEREKILEDALKYEGETMGHCVGGYCPDVISGRSRIYSLRDARGEPHVTVEVGKANQGARGYYDLAEDIQDEIRDASMDALRGIDDPKMWNRDESISYFGDQKLQEIRDQLARDWLKKNPQNEPERIVQIKGKQNRAPNEEYLPFVQDFVRGGKWSEVGDIKNTGLYRKSDFIDEFKPEQLDTIGQGEYLTFDEIKKLREGRPWKPIDTRPELDINLDDLGMKAGGPVKMAGGGAAFGIYPKQRATPSSEETKKAVKQASKVGVDLLLPQDAVDVGMMLVPGGKIARKAGAALIAGGASTDTEAGVMKEVLKNLLKPGAKAATQEVTAAERAAAGRKAAELIKSQPQVKASEALGQAMEKGFKKTTTTQADRTRVGGGNIGGAPFSAISEADPAYAGKVWGVMDEGTAARLKNLTDPETAWTTMLGSANQLKTNPIVFDKLKKGFLESMRAGNLSPELEAKINQNLGVILGEGSVIRDPKMWRQVDTFEKRAAVADLMMGQGLPPKKGGSALGGEKSGKGVIFKPTDTLIRETEPYLLHPEHGGSAPTFAAGPRLFSMDPVSEFRPDLHPGFPTMISGKDLGYNMIPTPTEVYLPDWHKAFKQKKPERFQGPWAEDILQRRKDGGYKLKGAEGPGYYDLALGLEGEGLPSQALNDAYIRHLIREGFKAGGAVSGLSTVNKLCGCHD